VVTELQPRARRINQILVGGLTQHDRDELHRLLNVLLSSPDLPGIPDAEL
jgi:hypothetical protein